MPGFTARCVAPGYPGPAVGGEVDGRGAIVMVDGSSTELIELGGSPVTSMERTDNYLAVAGGTVWTGYELDELEPDHPTLEGAAPVTGWATCADTDHRAVLAFDTPNGTVLGVWGYGMVPVPNRLYLRGDAQDVVVTSNQGQLVVAGPVDDGAPVAGSTAWVCNDPDGGELPWERLPLHPTATAVTGAAGWALHCFLAGRADADVVVWGYDGQALPIPDLTLGSPADRVLLARCPTDADDLSDLLVVTATEGSAMVHAIDGAGWRSAALPSGRLTHCTHVDTEDGEVLVAVVDGRIFVGELSG